MQMLQRVAPNVVAGTVCNHQKFGSGYTAASLSGQQHLRMYRGQGHGEFLANRVLALEGERIGDTRDRGGDVNSVERREHQMACLRSSDSDTHGFRVTHFTHDDHVWRLTQRGTQSG